MQDVVFPKKKQRGSVCVLGNGKQLENLEDIF